MILERSQSFNFYLKISTYLILNATTSLSFHVKCNTRKASEKRLSERVHLIPI